MAYFMGIDLGTSSVKTTIVDENGHNIAVSSRGYPVEKAPGGAAQQDTELWWQAVCQTVREALQASGLAPGQVEALGLSGQMHGLVALDAEGRPVAPARIWMDASAADYLHSLPQEKIAEITQNRPATGFLALSLGQMRRAEPALYARVRQVLLPKDYIRYRLCGCYGTDYSDASGSMAFNPVSLCWAEELLALLGLDKALFPACHAAVETAGCLTGEAARQTGLQEGTRVVYGGGDNAMQNLGNGLCAPGLLTSNIGTAAQLAAVVNRPGFDPGHRLNTFCYVQKDLWSMVGASLSGGGVLQWLAQDVLHRADFAQMDRQAETCPPCPGGLLFLPYLSGERSPWHNPKARGMFFGLERSHTDAAVIRSVMEGIVLSLRCSLEVMQEAGLVVQRVVASGGGAKSALWAQMQADIYNREVCVAENPEQACLGAAIVAAVGAGRYAGIEEACTQMVRYRPQTVCPKPENVYRYDLYFPLFKQLYEVNRPLFASLAALPR